MKTEQTAECEICFPVVKMVMIIIDFSFHQEKSACS